MDQQRPQGDGRQEGTGGIPFDEAAPRGLPGALWRTWRATVVAPADLFARVPACRGLARPLLYAALFGVVGALGWVAQQPLLHAVMARVPPGARIALGFFQLSDEARTLLLVLSPLLAVAGAVAAAVAHGAMALVGGAPGGYRVSLRAACYAQGAAAAAWVPLLGFLLPGIWLAYLLVVGLARAHRVETWRSAFGVLVPLMAFAGLGAALFIWLAAELARRLGPG